MINYFARDELEFGFWELYDARGNLMCRTAGISSARERAKEFRERLCYTGTITIRRPGRKR